MEVHLLHCHQVVPNLDLRVAKVAEQHEFHELVFIAEGRYEVTIGRQAYQRTASQGIIYPVGLAHLGKVTRDGASKLMLVQWWGSLPATADGPILFDDPTGHIRSSIFWLHGLPMDDAQRDEQRDAILVALLEQVRWQLAAGADFDDPIAEMHRFMQSTCGHAITMDLLGRRSGLAISTIGQKFRERYGIAPMHFLQRVRTETAANLLRGSTDDLAAIASQVGLASPSHLSRLLKKHLGTSARALRRSS